MDASGLAWCYIMHYYVAAVKYYVFDSGCLWLLGKKPPASSTCNGFTVCFLVLLVILCLCA